MDAPPALAAALRANRHALTHRLEQQLCVKMFVGSSSPSPSPSSSIRVSTISTNTDTNTGGGGVAQDAATGSGKRGRNFGAGDSIGNGSGNGGGNGGGEGSGGAGGNGKGVGSGGRRARGKDGVVSLKTEEAVEEAVEAETAAAVVVSICGMPRDVEAAKVYLADLDCSEQVVKVERKAFPVIFGAGGSNLRQIEVRFRLIDWLTG